MGVSLAEKLQISHCERQHNHIWHSAFSLIPKTAQGGRHYTLSFADRENGLERLIPNTIRGYWVSAAFHRSVQNSFTYNSSLFLAHFQSKQNHNFPGHINLEGTLARKEDEG